MSWRNNIRNFLMGTSYETLAAAPIPQVVRQVALEAPETAMAMEEALITELRRAEYHADAAVLSASDPAVRQASFRRRFDRLSDEADKLREKREAARLAAESDADVAPRPAPLIASAALDRSEKLAMRIDYQSMKPIQRKVA